MLALVGRRRSREAAEDDSGGARNRLGNPATGADPRRSTRGREAERARPPDPRRDRAELRPRRSADRRDPARSARSGDVPRRGDRCWLAEAADRRVGRRRRTRVRDVRALDSTARRPGRITWKSAGSVAIPTNSDTSRYFSVHARENSTSPRHGRVDAGQAQVFAVGKAGVAERTSKPRARLSDGWAEPRASGKRDGAPPIA